MLLCEVLSTHRSPEMSAYEASKLSNLVPTLNKGHENSLKKYCRPAGDLIQLANVEKVELLKIIVSISICYQGNEPLLGTYAIANLFWKLINERQRPSCSTRAAFYFTVLTTASTSHTHSKHTVPSRHSTGPERPSVQPIITCRLQRSHRIQTWE